MKKTTLFLAISLLFITLTSENCSNDAVSPSGVAKAQTTVLTDANGHSVEQNNIIARLKMDNMPGSIKHLYVISPYSGQVILYSTVKGKVTSGSKRLSPTSASGPSSSSGEFRIPIDGKNDFYTDEVSGDDGTYGSSSEYIYWWDIRGAFHQHFLTGGQIVHVSDVPLNVKSVIINVENVVK